MNSPLSRFGLTSEERVLRAVDSIRRGSGVLLVDDEDRENEGDLIFAADSMTVPQMAQMIRHCSGIVCLCLTEGKADELGLPLMVSNNTSRYGTAFTISIEAAEGVTTGVSASDRIATIRAAVASRSYFPPSRSLRRCPDPSRTYGGYCRFSSSGWSFSVWCLVRID